VLKQLFENYKGGHDLWTELTSENRYIILL